MKRGYYEYDPVIYPRLLWVFVGQKLKDVEDEFVESDGKDLKIESDDFYGLTLSEVKRKTDMAMGEAVVFGSKKDMTMNVCCHEASHVCDAIEETIGMEHGGEASAYLIGWIASCINKARLGIGTFMEMKDKEERK